MNEPGQILYDLCDELSRDKVDDQATAAVLERAFAWVERDRGWPFPDVRPAPAKAAV